MRLGASRATADTNSKAHRTQDSCGTGYDHKRE